jgi:hypothetical protein
MSSACDNVLSTPELLEAILIHVTPLNTLLHAQLVSQYFHKTITSSPKLQQLLFFRPSPSQDPQEWTLNPLLRKHFLPFFVIPGGGYKGTPRQFAALQLLPWTRSPSRKKAFLRAEASWRNMLLLQPPPKELQIIQWVHAMGGDSESKKTITFDDTAAGHVTMGRVYDIAESFAGSKFDSGSFGLSFIDKSPASPPYLALRLSYGVSCVRTWKPSPPSLASEAQELVHHKLEWDPRDPNWRRGFRNTSWKTDLTGERGGVESEEWQEWVREMGPVPEPEDESEPDFVVEKGEDGKLSVSFK